jgi:alpha-methylacyl-CoA racemase
MQKEYAMAGPLAGLRVIEFAGIGPVPFACMMLADHGAEVIRVCRPAEAGAGQWAGDDPTKDVLLRSRPAIEVDLKSEAGRKVATDLIKSADGLVEGFRPGVMERLGLDPASVLELRPSLVYGRMSGWGQTGPYARMAGHDINYIALAGALDGIGRAGDRPVPPGNLLGDFGGGGMVLAFGMVSAMHHAALSGEGQVIDCSILEGTALLTNAQRGYQAQGAITEERGANLLDSGAPFYDTYITSDGKYVAVGSIERKFFEILCDKLAISSEWRAQSHMDRRVWPALRAELAAKFASRTRDEWCAIFEQCDACFAPVLSLAESAAHPHNQARENFVEVGGITQARPAPRYSRTIPPEPRMPDGSTAPHEILSALGYPRSAVDELVTRGIVG